MLMSSPHTHTRWVHVIPEHRSVQQGGHVSSQAIQPSPYAHCRQDQGHFPKAYCVRPNSSRIDPGETLDVAVILSAMKEQPPPHAKCTDKFLVCSALIPVEKERMALSEFVSASLPSLGGFFLMQPWLTQEGHGNRFEKWHELESTNKAAIKEHRLKSVYLSDTETIPEDSAGDVTRYDDATVSDVPLCDDVVTLRNSCPTAGHMLRLFAITRTAQWIVPWLLPTRVPLQLHPGSNPRRCLLLSQLDRVFM